MYVYFAIYEKSGFRCEQKFYRLLSSKEKMCYQGNFE